MTQLARSRQRYEEWPDLLIGRVADRHVLLVHPNYEDVSSREAFGALERSHQDAGSGLVNLCWRPYWWVQMRVELIQTASRCMRYRRSILFGCQIRIGKSRARQESNLLPCGPDPGLRRSRRALFVFHSVVASIKVRCRFSGALLQPLLQVGGSVGRVPVGSH